MKFILSTCIAITIAVLSLSIPAPLLSSEASASKMNGRGMGCSDGCRSARYHAAIRRMNLRIALKG